MGCKTLRVDRQSEHGSRRFQLPLILSVSLLASLVGCDGNIGSVEPAEVEPPPYEPEPGPLRRLSAHEYRHTIEDLFGDAVVPPASLPSDERPGGEFGLIAVGVSTFALSGSGARSYEEAAYSVAEQAMAADDRDAFVGCTPGGVTDDACVDQFVRTFGRRAWRRPLSSDERARIVAIANDAAVRLDDFHGGLEFAIAYMLQSPYFVYRAEVGSPSEDNPGWYALSDWELATRLSYLIWSGPPDEALLDATAAGELSTTEGIEAQVHRMFEDEKASRGIRAFFDDMLLLDRLLNEELVAKDPEQFLHYNADVPPSAREETLRFAEDIVLRDADYGEMFTGRRTFIDRTLASVYAVPAPSRDGFGLYEHPEDSHRRGILGQLSLLMGHSNKTTSSATKRGAYLRRVLMCQPIPPPPPNIETTLPEASDAPTLRERVARHLEEPVCAGCHNLMDPLGLSLENFDAIGRFRTEENGETIDASGYLEEREFDDTPGLGRALAASETTSRCLVRTMFRYGTGHAERPAETVILRDLHEQFLASGRSVQSLILALATSDGFRLVAPPTETIATDAEESEVSE